MVHESLVGPYIYIYLLATAYRLDDCLTQVIRTTLEKSIPYLSEGLRQLDRGEFPTFTKKQVTDAYDGRASEVNAL